SFHFLHKAVPGCTLLTPELQRPGQKQASGCQQKRSKIIVKLSRRSRRWQFACRSRSTASHEMHAFSVPYLMT
ncbi:hypothetical protein, partial [Rhizobium anhuiense]|uniref:hypothetical protein n=1 Tax=Rhizobium anhuiense TaxID=1184720 RepID=UPI001AED011C